MKDSAGKFDGKWNRFLKPVNRPEIPRSDAHKSGEIIRLLQSFLDLNEDAAELKWDNFGYSSAKDAVGSTRTVVYRKQLPIEVLQCGNRLFLLRRVQNEENYLLPIDPDDIPDGNAYKTRLSCGRTKNILSDFVQSGFESCEINWGGLYKTVLYARNSFSAAIKRYGFPVRAVKRQGRLFLVREDSAD